MAINSEEINRVKLALLKYLNSFPKNAFYVYKDVPQQSIEDVFKEIENVVQNESNEITLAHVETYLSDVEKLINPEASKDFPAIHTFVKNFLEITAGLKQPIQPPQQTDSSNEPLIISPFANLSQAVKPLEEIKKDVIDVKGDFECHFNFFGSKMKFKAGMAIAACTLVGALIGAYFGGPVGVLVGGLAGAAVGATAVLLSRCGFFDCGKTNAQLPSHHTAPFVPGVRVF